MEYKPTIGLEIHAELKTQTKMFCDSKNDPEEKRPNVNICPVCMAHPGTLPVINREAVRHVLRVGKAIGGTLADFTEFDRKNYFYPDIPKGYQISQYKYPLVSGGNLSGADVTRVHLEEDTATSRHQGDHSLIDYNRAGMPLMELVTEPIIRDANHAITFAKELQLLLRYLNVSEANMEKGQMRVEANVSVSKTDEYGLNRSEGTVDRTGLSEPVLGTKVEVKNLNSFKIVGKAIEYEIKRQIKVLEDGGEVVQETRGWDEKKGETFSQRAKESSDDYRYFPDPDLPKLKISEIEEFQNLELPELPWEKRERYQKEYGIKDEDIESYVTNDELARFFEDVAEKLSGDKDLIKIASNYITSDIAGAQQDVQHRVLDKMESENFACLVEMANSGDVSSRGAKDILKIMIESGGDPKSIAEKKGLFQKSDEGELQEIVKKIISENEKAVTEYKSGKEASIQFLVGQGMRATKGAGNPQVLKKLFVELLNKE